MIIGKSAFSHNANKEFEGGKCPKKELSKGEKSPERGVRKIEFYLKLMKKKLRTLLYIYESTVFLADTDATGIVYFANFFRLAVEGLESLLADNHLAVSTEIIEGNFAFPVVHASADYKEPLLAGDHVKILLTVQEIGDSSVTLASTFIKEVREVAKLKVVHALVSKKTKKSVALPSKYRELFAKYRS